MAIEYLNRFECYLVNTAADALALVRRVDHPTLGILYDTHHAHIEEPDPEAAIAAAGRHIHHVHVSENHRGTPGEGQVAWDRTFKALKAADYDDWLVIEAFGRSDPDFAAAIHVWRDYASSPTALARGGHDVLREAWARA
jgi:D-psicose/D-tagatose/L-ribulose 3-epimerase